MGRGIPGQAHLRSTSSFLGLGFCSEHFRNQRPAKKQAAVRNAAFLCGTRENLEVGGWEGDIEMSLSIC